MSDKSRKSKKADAMAEKEVPLEATDDILADDIAAVEAETKAEDNKAKDKAKAPKKDADEGTEKKKTKAPKMNFKMSDVDPIIMVSFVVFLLACVVVIGGTVYDKTVADHTEAAAENGSKVIVDYTGSFYDFYDKEGAAIFDTSLSSVGNDSKYAKSWEYDKTSYSNITLTIGDGKYLALFEDSIIGHHPGDTIEVMIPAAQAYGALTDSDIKTISMTDVSMKKSQNFNADDYKAFFGVSAPATGAPVIVESPYGWDAKVVTTTNGMVSVSYMPKSGETYEMNKFVSLKVTNVIGEDIVFTYVVSGDAPSDELIQTIVDGDIVYIMDINGGNMTYKTTDEKTGENLYFTIKFIGYSTATA